MAKKTKKVAETPEQFASTHVKCAKCQEWAHIHEAWLNPADKEHYHYLCLPKEYREKLKRLRLIMADLSRRNVTGCFYIDLNNPAKIIVQKKDAPVFPVFSKGYRT